MIGWYHTGPKLRASDLEINELFKGFIARPVMVIVDVRPQTVGIPTDAYFAVEEIKDVRACPSEPFPPLSGNFIAYIYDARHPPPTGRYRNT
jgi:proteasome lid subunit RPN8/RPN11